MENKISVLVVDDDPGHRTMLNTLMEDCFDYALAAYPHGGGDTPQEYDGNRSVGFKL